MLHFQDQKYNVSTNIHLNTVHWNTYIRKGGGLLGDPSGPVAPERSRLAEHLTTKTRLTNCSLPRYLFHSSYKHSQIYIARRTQGRTLMRHQAPRDWEAETPPPHFGTRAELNWLAGSFCRAAPRTVLTPAKYYGYDASLAHISPLSGKIRSCVFIKFRKT